MNMQKLITAAFVALITCLATSQADAQWGAWGGGMGYRSWGHRYWAPEIGKVRLTVDINYSGTIRGLEGTNEQKRNPYGLVIGTNEMTKFQILCEPNQSRRPSIGEPPERLPFYKLVCSLDIKGVNLADPKGRFNSFEEEVAQCGRILVWLDSSRRYLLLDSADPARRHVDWPYAMSVPPSRVYIQALSDTMPGAAFLVTLELDDSNLNGICRHFGDLASWDRVLVTAHTPGIPKPYEDRTPVWVATGGGAGNTK